MELRKANCHGCEEYRQTERQSLEDDGISGWIQNQCEALLTIPPIQPQLLSSQPLSPPRCSPPCTGKGRPWYEGKCHLNPSAALKRVSPKKQNKKVFCKAETELSPGETNSRLQCGLCTVQGSATYSNMGNNLVTMDMEDSISC